MIPSKMIRERLAEVERRIEAKKKARLEISYTITHSKRSVAAGPSGKSGSGPEAAA
jgi:hypothetical protein